MFSNDIFKYRIYVLFMILKIKHVNLHFAEFLYTITWCLYPVEHCIEHIRNADDPFKKMPSSLATVCEVYVFLLSWIYPYCSFFLYYLKGHWTSSTSYPNFFQKSWDFYTIISVGMGNDRMPSFTF